MNCRKLGVLSAVLAVVTIPSIAGADPYRDSGRHFQLELPEGWRPLPAEELARFNSATKNGRYEGAFGEQGKLFGSAPYILYLAHGAYVGASYDDIEKDVSSSGKLKVVTYEAEPLETQFRKLAPGEALLDRGRNRVFIRGRSDFGLVKIQTFSVSHLGSDGTVQIIGYAADREVADFIPVFAKINESFKFDPGKEFKQPTLSPARQGRGFESSSGLITRIVLAAVLAVMGGLALYLALRKRGPDNAGNNSFARSLAMGAIVFLLFLAANVLFRRSWPDLDRLLALIVDFLLASVIVGLLSRRKAWSRVGTAVVVFLFGFVFVIGSTSWFVFQSASDLDLQEKWLQDCIDVYQDSCSVLEKVRDEESARSVVPDLERLVRRFDELVERTKQRIDVSKADRDRLMSQYMPTVAANAKRLVELFQSSAAKARGERSFEDALDRLQKAYMRLRNT